MTGDTAMRKFIVICILIFLGMQNTHAQKMTVKDSDANILKKVNEQIQRVGED